MDRRLFLTGLLGVAGTAAIATALPRPAEALTGDPLDYLRPPRPDGMPSEEVADSLVEEGEEYARHGGAHRHGEYRRHRRRRRRRYRRWRRRCWWRHGRRICRREPYWFWGFF